MTLHQPDGRLPRARLLSALALLVSACVVTGCDAVLPSVEETDSPELRVAVDAYLSAIQSRDLETAFGVLCRDGRESRAGFDDRVRRTAGDIGGIESWTFSRADELSNGRGVVRYQVTTERGTFKRKVDLERESGRWCLSNIDG